MSAAEEKLREDKKFANVNRCLSVPKLFWKTLPYIDHESIQCEIISKPGNLIPCLLFHPQLFPAYPSLPSTYTHTRAVCLSSCVFVCPCMSFCLPVSPAPPPLPFSSLQLVWSSKARLQERNLPKSLSLSLSLARSLAKVAILLVSASHKRVGILKMPLSLSAEEKLAFINMVQSYSWIWLSSLEDYRSRIRESYLSLAREMSSGMTWNNNNNNNGILIKREPLIYTRARRAVQKKTRK